MFRRRDNIIVAIVIVAIVGIAAGLWEYKLWLQAQPPPKAQAQPNPLIDPQVTPKAHRVAATGNLPGPGVVLPNGPDRARLELVAEKKKHDAWLADSARKYPLPDNLARSVRMWKSVMEPNGDMYLVPADPGPPPDRYFVSIATRHRDEAPSELSEAAAAVLREKSR
jgi:hypothetical protein